MTVRSSFPTELETREALRRAGIKPEPHQLSCALKYTRRWAEKFSVKDKERVLWELVETLRPEARSHPTSKRDAKGHWVHNGRHAGRATGRIIK